MSAEKQPDVLFEVSWEVANMVGGIHTVLLTKAGEMVKKYGSGYICVGPNIPHRMGNIPVFRDEIWDTDFHEALQDLNHQGVACRMGRWLIPGEPKCILVGFKRLLEEKDRILSHYWERYGLNSLFGEYDYLEPVLFSHGVGLLIEQVYLRCLLPKAQTAVVHCHEWMTGAAALHLKERVPEVGLVFTTHATILGRSLSSRNREVHLLDQAKGKNPAQLAEECGIVSKHSLEAILAREADCFTTVSTITAEECQALLLKRPDIVTPNALGDDVPPKALLTEPSRTRARKRLLEIAGQVTGTSYDSDSTFIAITSGRYEFINKGIDIFIESLADLRGKVAGTHKRILGFVLCPRDHGPARVVSPNTRDPQISTHEIPNNNDSTIYLMHRLGMQNTSEENIHIVLVPIYLDGHDTNIREEYWNLLSGADVGVFASWYEPWGYTPLEAIGVGVPTITSDLAGFGSWAAPLGQFKTTGVDVITRKGRSYESAKEDICSSLFKLFEMTRSERENLSRAALSTSSRARWAEFSKYYFQAHSKALLGALDRTKASSKDRFRSFSLGKVVAPSEFSAARAHVRQFSVTTRFPYLIHEMLDVAGKAVEWTWNPRVTRLLSELDPVLWKEVDQDPQKFIALASPILIKRLSENHFRRQLEEIRKNFAEYRNERPPTKLAYFCMEYGISSKLRTYAGGLGMLAGDHLKTAADRRTPLCAFGLFYRYGYFRQFVSTLQGQESHYHRIAVSDFPLQPVTGEDGKPLLLTLQLETRKIFIKAWKVQLRGVDLYLIDTDVDENPSDLRLVTDHLYNADPKKRLHQEWVLSMGGLAFMKYLKIPAQAFHMNEGHNAFLILGRCAELMEQSGLSFDEALTFVKNTTIFTTHTPVAAGHDQFHKSMVHEVLKPFLEKSKIPESTAMELGRSVVSGPSDYFSMTGLAIRGCQYVNGVSQIHGAVSRKMFHMLYPDIDVEEVPISGITNGVHVPSWLDPMWQNFFYKEIDLDWPLRLCAPEPWNLVREMSLEKIWNVKKALKCQLIEFLTKHIRTELRNHRDMRPELAAVLANLSQNSLLITHAKRLAPYKRADLLFSDPDRLRKLFQKHPEIIFIYSGKAHPSDGMGQDLLRRILHFANEPGIIGHILFVENYDMSFSRKLMSGSDVWLNTPIRPLEACGTSGMKAGINGTLNLSVADGWWPEIFNGKNGWMIGEAEDAYSDEIQSLLDTQALFHLIETEMAPMFNQRDEKGMPVTWVERCRESIASLMPFVNSERMLREYERKLYSPAIQNAARLSQNGFEALKSLQRNRELLFSQWSQVEFIDASLSGIDAGKVARGNPVELSIQISHPGLMHDSLEVQAVLTRGSSTDHRSIISSHPLSFDRSEKPSNQSWWKLRLTTRSPGDYGLMIRVLPKQANGTVLKEIGMSMVRWL